MRPWSRATPLAFPNVDNTRPFRTRSRLASRTSSRNRPSTMNPRPLASYSVVSFYLYCRFNPIKLLLFCPWPNPKHCGNKAEILPSFVAARKSQDGRRLVTLTRLQFRGRKIRMLWRIGKVLGFQAKASPDAVRLPALAFHCPIQKVAAVELNPWFGCLHLKQPPTGRFVDLCRNRQAAVCSILEDPVGVATFTELKWLIVFADLSADGHRFSEIER